MSESLSHNHDTVHVPDEAPSTEDKVLETGASFLQDFKPIKQICAHLNAFHAYASDPTRAVEANHYCSHVTRDVRQCLIYDSPAASARLIGIEYMVTPEIYAKLPADERKLWHSHVFEVKSGMLVMPGPTSVGAMQAWEAAETKEMEHVIGLYGKVYHLWQLEDEVPLGEPQLMTSYVAEGQLDFEGKVKERDQRFGVDYKRKKGLREGIVEPAVHEDADQAWKRRNSV